MTITKMREEIDALNKELNGKMVAVQGENRRPDAEERAWANKKLDAIHDLEDNINFQERMDRTEERLNKPQSEPTKPEPNHAIPQAEQEKADRFMTFGEQLTAVIQAGSPGGMVDQRLSTRAITGMGETVASDGGFLVQSDFAAGIIKNVWDTGAVASRVNRIGIGPGKNGMKFNGIDETSRVNGSRAGGIQMYWLNEAGTKTASKPKFRQIDLQLKKLIGLCYATDELLEDANALEAEITSAFRDEMNFKLSDAFINGTGAGMPLGVMPSGSLITVAKEAGQSATTINFENVTKMWSRQFADSWPNAVWFINQDCIPQLQKLAVPVGTGGAPVYVPPGGATASPYSSLFGRPVIPIEQAQTLGTKGDILLADFMRGYKAIDKAGMKQDVSIHVRYVYDESVFRFVYRVDGQPVLAKAVTPFKGTNTLGHFVALASRA